MAQKKEKIELLKDGGFNHYRVAQAVIPALTSANLSAEVLSHFERIFTQARDVLNAE